MPVDANFRPVPTATRTTSPFWEAAKEGRFLLQFDAEARKYQFWPRPVSVYSGSAKLEWRESTGRGVLVSRSNVNIAQRGFEKIIPFVLAAVDLDEGVRVVGRLHGIPFEDARVGMRLKLIWEDLSSDSRFFMFERDA